MEKVVRILISHKVTELLLAIGVLNLLHISFSCHELGEAQALPALLCDGEKDSSSAVFFLLYFRAETAELMLTLL